MQVVLSFGLKHLWNIMNLLQFLCFMILWQIRLPHTTRIIISELKSLAFMEFIPTEWFKKSLRSALGIEELEKDPCNDELEAICDRSGSERLGSSDLVENMGAMLLIAFGLILVLALLVVLGILGRKYTKIRKAYLSVKKKVLYNSLLRYVLQSSLKLQMAACTVIFFEKLATEKFTKEISMSQIATSVCIVIVFNICPFFFLSMLVRNQENLGKDEIKEKIGTLYNGLKPIKSVAGQSFVFLLRRSIFVAITFLLFEDPNMQVLLFIWLTLLYITYVNHSQIYESSKAKALETFNEVTFCLLQYNLVLLNNLVEPEVDQ